MTKTKELKNKGITLIALIITIIVMLILVSVTISMAINGGLFEKAGGAVSDTQNAIDKEQTLASGKVTIDGKEYNSIDEYIIGKDSKKSYDKAEKDANGFLLENATYESDGYTAVIPKGFKISDVTGEKAIATGLVVIDKNDNEFVWIPVTTDLASSYTFSASDPLITEPAEVSDDIGRGYDFVSEYNQMVAGVNANNGFYIGRYETTGTVGGTNIGSKYNTQILYSNNWYDLYEEQKSANIEGNGTNIQTAMIYGILWDETMAFIDLKDDNYDINTWDSNWGYTYSNVEASQTNYSLAGIKNTSDVALNIWGLASNFGEWTQESAVETGRVIRGHASPGGDYSNFGASSRGAVVGYKWRRLL